MQDAGYITFRSRLEALGFDSYGAYLASPHWKGLRAKYRQSGRPQRCSVCRSHRFQLHHLTYERLGAELLDDLVPLCRWCHDKTHGAERRGAALEEAHQGVEAPVFIRPQYQQDRERARRRALGIQKPKRRRRSPRYAKSPPATKG